MLRAFGSPKMSQSFRRLRLLQMIFLVHHDHHARYISQPTRTLYGTLRMNRRVQRKHHRNSAIELFYNPVVEPCGPCGSRQKVSSKHHMQGILPTNTIRRRAVCMYARKTFNVRMAFNDERRCALVVRGTIDRNMDPTSTTKSWMTPLVMPFSFLR